MNITVIQTDPKWAKKNTILTLFEIGEVKLAEYREKGYVRVVKHGHNAVYRTSDIDSALEAECKGHKPRVMQK